LTHLKESISILEIEPEGREELQTQLKKLSKSMEEVDSMVTEE
jgi:Asp-tRNA(Asn)/Glu-tRNA(Gln) amidotransferase C subunit